MIGLSPTVSRLFAPAVVNPLCPIHGIQRRRVDRSRRGLSRWPIRRTLNMASGDVMLDSSGKVVLSDGSTCPNNPGDLLLSNGSGDSCYCGGSLCAQVCGGRISAITALVAISYCTSCVPAPGGTNWTLITPTSWSGTYTLSPTGSGGGIQCIWKSAPFTVTVETFEWSSPTCSSGGTQIGPSTSTNAYVQVDLSSLTVNCLFTPCVGCVDPYTNAHFSRTFTGCIPTNTSLSIPLSSPACAFGPWFANSSSTISIFITP